MLTTRRSGVLCHISSLPSRYGIGDFGPEAYRFVDFLAGARQGLWQILPLNPTVPALRHSPYDAASAFAGNPLFLSPEWLRDEGLLSDSELREALVDPEGPVDYDRAVTVKTRILKTAYERFRRQSPPGDYRRFLEWNSDWLTGFALFTALQGKFPTRAWRDWPVSLRDRRDPEISVARRELAESVRETEFVQYCFSLQWHKLKRYANERGVCIMGDIPFYVGSECSETWLFPELFTLTAEKTPAAVAGVPPDRFGPTGQLWGNPVYEWRKLADTGYAWWIRRLRHNLDMFDMARLDHFRAFAAYWEIPAESKTAAGGRWVEGPGRAFLREVFRHFPFASLIAEDLGTITPDVRELMREFALPGMAVLQFAFDHDTGCNAYTPHNHRPNSVLYTGTHDNNTSRGWFEHETDEATRRRLYDYLGREVSAPEAAGELIRLGMMSVCRMLVIPMQDLLGLGAGARMNHPGTMEGNWTWRLPAEPLSDDIAKALAGMTERYGRG